MLRYKKIMQTFRFVLPLELEWLVCLVLEKECKCERKTKRRFRVLKISVGIAEIGVGGVGVMWICHATSSKEKMNNVLK